MTTEEVRERLRERVEAAGGQSAWARRHAVSSVYVSDALAGRRLPGPAILQALRLRRIESEARYVELPGE